MMLQPRKEAVLNDQVVQALVGVVKEREQVFFLAQAVEVGVAQPLLATEHLDNVWDVEFTLDEITVVIDRVKEVLEPRLRRQRARHWVSRPVRARRELGL